MTERCLWFRKHTPSDHVLSTYGAFDGPHVAAKWVSLTSRVGLNTVPFINSISKQVLLLCLALFLLLLYSREWVNWTPAVSLWTAALPIAPRSQQVHSTIMGIPGWQDEAVCVHSSEVCATLSHSIRIWQSATSKSKALQSKLMMKRDDAR